jgi:hypothetical protein
MRIYIITTLFTRLYVRVDIITTLFARLYVRVNIITTLFAPLHVRVDIIATLFTRLYVRVDIIATLFARLYVRVDIITTLFARLYVRVDIVFTCGKHDRMFSLRGKVWALRTSLASVHLLKCLYTGNEWSCICFGILILSHSTIFYCVLEMFRQCDIFCFSLSMKGSM